MGARGGQGEGRGKANPPATPSSAAFPWELVTALITGKNHSPFPPAKTGEGLLQMGSYLGFR